MNYLYTVQDNQEVFKYLYNFLKEYWAQESGIDENYPIFEIRSIN